MADQEGADPEGDGEDAEEHDWEIAGQVICAGDDRIHPESSCDGEPASSHVMTRLVK
jgi:hypothetical protein